MSIGPTTSTQAPTLTSDQLYLHLQRFPTAFNESEKSASMAFYNGTHWQPPEDVIDQMNSDKFERLLPALVYIVILMIVGTPGNLIVWIIYYKRWKKCSTRIFILALATFDLINCSISLPVEIFIMVRYFKFDSAVVCKFSRFLTYVCNSAAALVLLAIAVDRYHRICKPHSTHMTTRMAKCICMTATIISFLSCWPSVVFYGIQYIPVPNRSDVVIKMCLIENGYLETNYPLAYFIFNTICTLSNFVMLSVLYSFVGVQVCKRWRFRAKKARPSASTPSIRSVDSANQFNNSAMQLNGLVEKKEENGLTKEKSISPSEQKFLRPDSIRSTTQNTSESLNGSISRDFSKSPRLIRRALLNASLSLRSGKGCDERARRMGKTTFMLFIVTVVYILSFLPFLIIAIHRSVSPSSWSIQTKTNEKIFNLIFRSYLLNCAVNPIVYSFCNSLFRKECLQLFSNIIPSRRQIPLNNNQP